MAARLEVETIAREFSAGHWKQAVGSSGTARALGDILRCTGGATAASPPRAWIGSARADQGR